MPTPNSRAARRRGAALQPLLHAAHRRAAGRLADRPSSRSPKRACCTSSPIATGSTASELASDLGSRCRLSQPHPARLRDARPDRQADARDSDGRQSLLSITRARPRALRAARTRIATTTSPRCWRSSPTPDADAPGRRDATIEGVARRTAAPRAALSCCARRSPATWAGSSAATARSTPQEYGWDERVRSAGRRKSSPTSSRNFDPASASAAGSPRRDGENVGSVLLVKRDRRRSRELRLLLVEPKARGLGIGAPPGRRMRPLRARDRLPQDHAVDPQRAHRRPPHLRAGRLHAGRHLDARRLRQGAHRRELGFEALTRSLLFSGQLRSETVVEASSTYTVAPCALARRRCSSSRGMISTKLQGR